MTAFIRTLSRATNQFFWPAACHWCTGMLPEVDYGQGICSFCLLKLAPICPDRCLKCSAPIGPYLGRTESCLACQRESLPFQSAVSLGAYDDQLLYACLACKHSTQAPLTASLTRLLYQREQDHLTAQQIDLIVPVPHFWIDRLLRFHHPSETIARELGRLMKVRVHRHLLVKSKWTRKQMRLNGQDRRRNLQSAFRMGGYAKLDGLRILLTDDVMTTGTTLRRAAQTLFKAGAESVHVAVLARCLIR